MAASNHPTEQGRAATSAVRITTDASAPAAVATEPPYDVAAVIDLCIGQAAFAASLIESFQADCEDHLVTLRTHAAQDNAQAIGDAAHALKGSAAIVSANRVRRIAAEIQEAGERGQVSEARRLIDPLSREISACRDFLAVVRETAHRATPHPGSE